jgi:hypothetical protein
MAHVIMPTWLAPPRVRAGLFLRQRWHNPDVGIIRVSRVRRRCCHRLLP